MRFEDAKVGMKFFDDEGDEMEITAVGENKILAKMIHSDALVEMDYHFTAFDEFELIEPTKKLYAYCFKDEVIYKTNNDHKTFYKEFNLDSKYDYERHVYTRNPEYDMEVPQ